MVEALDVSRETLDRLAVYLDLLERWNAAINLVGRSTLCDPWRRHVLDSGQLVRHLPSRPGVLVDLGSGAGLPGLILAIIGVAEVHLVEADGRKAQFLREAARATECRGVSVHARRIEALDLKADTLTARALAPLTRLLGLAEPLVHEKTRCLFLKGRSADEELTAARRQWTMRSSSQPSLVDPNSHVLILEGIRRGNA